MPLAYLITFTTYGVWLHGLTVGSVDKEHNQPGDPFLPPDLVLETQMRGNMRESPYLLDSAHRPIVLETIREVARHRRWHVMACHVRTNHVHIVVAAEARPEKVMSDFKAYASRRLREYLGEPADCKRGRNTAAHAICGVRSMWRRLSPTPSMAKGTRWLFSTGDVNRPEMIGNSESIRA